MENKKKNFNLKKLKKNVQGITLIVLVVTIIVLLILAGVALSLTVGDNGLFKRAQNAVDTYEGVSEREEIEMALASSFIDSVSGRQISKEELEESLKNQFGNKASVEDNGDGSFFVTINENQYYIEDGKIADSIKISTASELKSFREEVNNGNTYEGKYVYLTNDIKLDSSEEWKPIGYYSNKSTSPLDETNQPFKGIFNGNGYEIDGIYINTTDKAQGLFGIVDNGKIYNIVIGENCSISGSIAVAGVAGYIFNGAEIYNCYNKANVEGTTHTAGIAGIINEKCKVSNCYNLGTINGKNDSTGGISAYVLSSSIISNCYNEGSIIGKGGLIGGISGQVENSSVIEASYNKGIIHGKNVDIGGVVGLVTKNNSIIKDSYNIGEVIGEGDHIGGIAGQGRENVVIMNCYNAGVINGDNAIDLDGDNVDINSIVGLIGFLTINNCYTIER